MVFLNAITSLGHIPKPMQAKYSLCTTAALLHSIDVSKPMPRIWVFLYFLGEPLVALPPWDIAISVRGVIPATLKYWMTSGKDQARPGTLGNLTGFIPC